jgi:polysaccharide biosynthesis protein PslH
MNNSSHHQPGTMKITLVCHEIPYPPIHGGRIDMWRRIKAFAAQGVELQIIAWWFSTQPTPAEITEIQKYAQKVDLIQIERTWLARIGRIGDLRRYPLEVTARIVKGHNLDRLKTEVANFAPDLIFLDGIHGGVIAETLHQCLHVPIITRSHNIEHLYYQRILKSAVGFKQKLKRYLSVMHLEQYERDLLAKSAVFYDISTDDLKFWQSAGFNHGRLLSPLIEPINDSDKLSDRLNKVNQIYDLVFLGNLSLENNVAGVIWFITEVLPIVRTQLPEVRVLIAGLNPVADIHQICTNHQNVTLLANPASAAAIYQSGRVLINPILTGSGVKIKSIEMLGYNKPIVSTLEGVSGLPDAVKPYFKIADDARSFALLTITALSTEDHLVIDRQLLDSLFGYQTIETVVTDLTSMLNN